MPSNPVPSLVEINWRSTEISRPDMCFSYIDWYQHIQRTQHFCVRELCWLELFYNRAPLSLIFYQWYHAPNRKIAMNLHSDWTGPILQPLLQCMPAAQIQGPFLSIFAKTQFAQKWRNSFSELPELDFSFQSPKTQYSRILLKWTWVKICWKKPWKQNWTQKR